MVRGKKLDSEAMSLSSLLERLTHARVKDCFKEEDVIYFVVAPGDLGKAVGKQGIIVHTLQRELGKRVRIVEYRDSVEEFVRMLIYPLKVREIIVEGEIILLRDDDKKTKSLLIGRDSKNLQFINKVVKRFFNVDVKVV